MFNIRPSSSFFVQEEFLLSVPGGVRETLSPTRWCSPIGKTSASLTPLALSCVGGNRLLRQWNVRIAVQRW